LEEADKILALTDPKLKSSESWSKKADEIRELRKQYNFSRNLKRQWYMQMEKPL
jgi:hypothetical protein